MRMSLVWTLALLGACIDAADAPEVGLLDVCTPGEPQVIVVTEITIAREADGVAQGFDLDGLNSRGEPDSGCGIEDWVDPDGASGIDNALALLMPALELTEANAAEDLLNRAINEGEVLILVESIAPLPGSPDDSCASVEVVRGFGETLVGTHGYLVPGQTFDADRGTREGVATEVALADGSGEAHHLDLRLPFAILDAELELVFLDGAVRYERHEDGSYTGLLGGAVEWRDILDQLNGTGIASEVKALLELLLAQSADMHPDAEGACRSVSAGITFTGEEAFIFP